MSKYKKEKGELKSLLTSFLVSPSCSVFSRQGAITETLDKGLEGLEMTEQNTKWQEEMKKSEKKKLENGGWSDA